MVDKAKDYMLLTRWPKNVQSFSLNKHWLNPISQLWCIPLRRSNHDPPEFEDEPGETDERNRFETGSAANGSADIRIGW